MARFYRVKIDIETGGDEDPRTVKHWHKNAHSAMSQAKANWSTRKADSDADLDLAETIEDGEKVASVRVERIDGIPISKDETLRRLNQEPLRGVSLETLWKDGKSIVPQSTDEIEV